MGLMKSRRGFRRTLVLGLLLFALPLGLVLMKARARHAQGQTAAAALAYKLADGPYAVATVEEMTLRDAKRGKDLPVRILYPKTGGPFPVILFSHGAGGSGDNYQMLTRYWATHGYVVIQPTHDDSLKLRREKGMEMSSSLREELEENLTDPKGWETRARDISFILDSMGEIERRVPALKGKLDERRVGVGGHSYGAYTSALVAGASIDIPGGAKGQTFRDERPRAFLMLSPQGRDQMGLTENSWQKINRPAMTMTGSNDTGARSQGPEWRKDPFNFSPPGDKYHVFIEGANHFSFTGRFVENGAGAGPLRSRLFASPLGDQKAVFDYVKLASLAFWDAYLKGDDKAKAYLKSDDLINYSRGSVTISRK